MKRLGPGAVELTFGTHNLLHGRAAVAPFADVIVFTEADQPGKVRTRLALTHRCFHRHEIPGVVIATRRGLLGRGTECVPYVAHPGEAGLTPRRGSLAVEGPIAATGMDLGIIGHHRINAAWPPYRFPEGDERRALRKRLWRTHRAVDEALVHGQLHDGLSVLAGGDGNRREGAQVWPDALVNLGKGTDRLAVSGDVEVVGFEELAKAGSDHHRYRATVRLYARVNDRPEVSGGRAL